MAKTIQDTQEDNSKILSALMLIILFVSMGQSVYWQTMPIIGREFNFSEIEINTLVSISAAAEIETKVLISISEKLNSLPIIGIVCQ